MHLVARGRDEMVGKWAAARCGAEKFYICERGKSCPIRIFTVGQGLCYHNVHCALCAVAGYCLCV